MNTALSDRFYKAVDIAVEGDGYSVRLDGRCPKTPGGVKLLLPTEAAARLVSNEWDAQEAKIDLPAMQFTQIAFAALDQVTPHQEAIVDELAAYGGSDLVCFFADEPLSLIEKQKTAWLSLHEWFQQTWQTKLETSQGIIAATQSPQTLDAIKQELIHQNAFQLASLHGLTKLSGSVILALAVAKGRLSADEAWSASRIDEEWQIARWGRDAEADKLANDKRSSFLANAAFLASLS